jgi:hypothetical protein
MGKISMEPETEFTPTVSEEKKIKELIPDVPAKKKDEPLQSEGMGSKLIGRYVDPDNGIKPVTFLSKVKELMLFGSADYMIKFVQRSFVTNYPNVLNYMRNHKLIGKEYWEGEFPEWYKEKMRKDKETLTQDEKEYDSDGKR